MLTQQDFNFWEDLERYVHNLEQSRKASINDFRHCSTLLYRGHADCGWQLATTLERSAPKMNRLSDYYRAAAVAKTQIESFTARSWPEINCLSVADRLTSYDTLRHGQLPHCEYLAYLRHHGFPSPLLDWTRSLYIAAFFAFERPRASRVAIFVYQEYAGHGKLSVSDKPQIHSLGPNINTHQRHFLQQAEYTAALRFQNQMWMIDDHTNVFLNGNETQDRLWKLTLPASEAPAVMRKLEQYNINAFSLFQSEDALLATVAASLFQR